MEWSELRGIDLHLERNYTDILSDIHCSEGNQIYVGIKRDVPLQISLNVEVLQIHFLKIDAAD